MDSSAVDACLFCGATSDTVPFSKEDVVPKWLLRLLQLPAHDKMLHLVAESATGLITKAAKHSSFTFLEPRVCRHACNNGWMSRLEKAAHPIIEPLISNARSLSSLTESEKRILYKWAAKTAYLHAAVGLLAAPISAEHLHALDGDAGEPLPGVVVFGMQGDYWKLSSYVQTGRWPQAAPADKVLESQSPAAAFKIGLQFGHLYLLVAYWPDLHSRFLVRPWYFPIGPSGLQPLPYAGTLPENQPIDLLIHFASELAVVHSIPGL